MGCLSVWAAQAQAQAQGIPPSAGDLLSDPAIYSPQLSPDGAQLAYLRSAQPGDPDGTWLFILDVADGEGRVAQQVNLGERRVVWASWANNDRLLISYEVVSDVEGRGAIMFTESGDLALFKRVKRRQIVAIDVDGANPQALFDFNNRRFNTVFNLDLDQVIDYLPSDPDHILMPARTGRRGGLDIYRVNVYTGETERVVQGRARTIAWFTNGAGVPVMRWDVSSSWRTVRIMVRAGEGQRWRTVTRMPIRDFGRLNQDYTWAARSDLYDEALVFARSSETGTIGLYRYGLREDGLRDPIFLNSEYDVDTVLSDPHTGALIAYSWADTHTHVEVPDPVLSQHLAGLRGFFGPDVTVLPMQRAEHRVLLQVSGPLEPNSYYVYDMQALHVTPVGASQPRLMNRALAPVSVVHYTARDGQPLFGYLTMPAAPAGTPPPLVVMPHGGPERRDFLSFDVMAQLVAAEGYAVFQPQFRGSSGFGAAFAEQGYGEMAGLIQSDILDGVLAVLDSGQVDPDRVCVAGWSFGGYAALMQVIQNPELYKCAFAGAPVTDLPEMLAWHRGFQDEDDETLAYVETMLGYPDTNAMVAGSPARRASEITVPVLLVHGRDDDIVPYEQSELMLEALSALGADVTLVPFDGGHSPDMDGELVTINFHRGRFLHAHLIKSEAEP